MNPTTKSTPRSPVQMASDCAATAPVGGADGKSSSLACPACDGTDLLEQTRLHFSTWSKVVRCSRCRLEFVDPFLPSDLGESSTVTSAGYLDEMVTDYRRLLPLINAHAERRLEFYRKLLGYKPARIFEVGAATGSMVKAYEERGVEAVGMEIDPQLIQHAGAIGAPVFEGDICSYDLAPLGQFDVVFSSQTLEHILRPQLALAKMLEVLRPGGILHLDVPNANSWGSRVRRVYHGMTNWGAIQLPHHQLGYYATTLRSLFDRFGLETIEIRELPTDDPLHGQFILPLKILNRLAMRASHLLGHGYLLVGVARKAKQLPA